ncbi:MAG: hypothetical protein RI556_07460 [Hydrogenovibrio sp.]|uniref:hypothetical protein n=1 Tax=Hydrogenovibrio sp. TaxID=2065821 RepID=UPI00286FC7C0|nr:hypothetical protein [Hydrogenovibrio sp.]MDR9498996.1 hypothetical protein [Hydrogenovibrio sp.]
MRAKDSGFQVIEKSVKKTKGRNGPRLGCWKLQKALQFPAVKRVGLEPISIQTGP